MFYRIINDVHTLIFVCCYRGRVGTDFECVGGVLIYFCFHVVVDVSVVSVAN